MTNLQEAKLAREAEICYATLALVTDYDCWHPDHDSVTVEMIVANLMQNAQTAQAIIAEAVGRLPGRADCACGSALATAIITRPDAIPAHDQAGAGADHREVREVAGSWPGRQLTRRLGPVRGSCYPLTARLPASDAIDHEHHRHRFDRLRLPDVLSREASASTCCPSTCSGSASASSSTRMDKRRGGCAPNIAYTLALLGERPRADGHGRAGLRRVPAVARGGRAWTRRSCKQVPGKFTASFFCSTDRDGNQIASFYTGAMAHAGGAVVPRRPAPATWRSSRPNDPARDGAVRRGVPDAGHSLHLRPEPAGGAHERRGAQGGRRRRAAS